MISRRSLMVGAFSSALAVGASAYAQNEDAKGEKSAKVPFAPSPDDADDRAFTKEVEKAAPNSDPRTTGYGSLQLYREATGESIAARYRYEGGVDRRSIAELSWFWRDVKDDDKALWIDPTLFDFVSSVQSTMSMIHGSMLPFILTSGYRTRRHNASIETAARNSLHIDGLAGDLKVPGYPPRSLAIAAMTFKGGGVGVYSRFTHLDVGQIRCWPYSCNQIMGGRNG
ncbi:hypothetical protein A6U87_27315 [Rhizobium sp. AC44/96]|uniref:YcbK family protein n=1 Tax=Rhizobium sp. AC44/96 TaxID=1841654 RepID=UPI00080FE0D6|nr:DUF882 domain-containing protein [Rhizobium sp. AC44/96]OCJ11456.1 hypothetical protein A6U87_27315 [Rhizobium sp. AC44/96]